MVTSFSSSSRCALNSLSSLVAPAIRRPEKSLPLALQPEKNTLQDSLPRVVARELLKGKGLENSDAPPMLPKAFKLQPPLNIINGYNMPIQALLDLFNVYTSVRAPGCGAFGLTITMLGTGMLRLLVFLEFVVKLLASPGMCASAILELFELASELHGTVPPKARGIVSHVVFPDIEATLLSFS